MGYLLFYAPNAARAQHEPSVSSGRMLGTVGVLGLLGLAFLAHPPLDPRGFAQIALTFSGLSLMLFGGGYVFIPMIQDVVVTQYGWLSTQQFLDGVAFSQITPGPILIIATFIGQKVITEQYGWPLGLLGAVIGTVSFFTPPALLMITTSRALDSIQQAPWLQAAMRGIRCGVLGMIAVAAVVILYTSSPAWPRSLLMSAWFPYVRALWPTLVIFAAALVALIKYNVDVVWIIPVAGLLGLLLY